MFSLLWACLATPFHILWKRQSETEPMTSSSAGTLGPRKDPGDDMDLPIIIKDGQPVTLRQLQAGNISGSDFHFCLDLYRDHVRDVYQHLETQRFESIPEALMSRRPPYLTKDEVIDLEKWLQYVLSSYPP